MKLEVVTEAERDSVFSNERLIKKFEVERVDRKAPKLLFFTMDRNTFLSRFNVVGKSTVAKGVEVSVYIYISIA